MIRISSGAAIELQDRIIQETGGSYGLRDEGLLESVLEAPFATFAGVDLFHTVEEKAARLGYGLVANHAFLDGNKRVGVLVMLAFAKVNGLRLEYTDEDIVWLGFGMADGSLAYEDYLAWIRGAQKAE
ncbi:MAG: type II toxin-antitoxin system death-on-curing family toxin [Clostridia bacterium]|nr:type II toxin-antitoxin system death-on-curing family toxin [Clostridia bacterium]